MNSSHISPPSKAAKDPELRGTLIEVALSRIEEKTGFTLSRTIATPNIKSKGAIPPRTARIPAFWASAESTGTARIQELDATAVPLWTWSPTREGCRIVIQVPDLTKSLHASSTLDLEARRLIFTSGSRYHLDTPLLPPNQGSVPVGGTKFLPTTVDPDSAVANWDVKNKELVVQVKWTSVAAREKEKNQSDV
ncbi:unnamed protein product [Rhizoctonia solani]|uniref:Uncharacterized protein n=1 Tax=Rhizoctonia solani TaxID=456999 RepID=A0A8H3DIU3_9AGAM|nr:unnamed protein product [Rhizoctonia solani]